MACNTKRERLPLVADHGGLDPLDRCSVNRGIFGAAITIAVLTLAAGLVAVAKELAIAGTFGTGDVLDAFLIF